ncbi:MAG: RNA methyltransferase [Bacteroidales bacterium]|jgi:tRNA (guanosine-2'-O-)-methyltransferase|nr:RNA methyltransferase [Bacteroidales bacterium]
MVGELINFLKQFATEGRNEVFDRILNNRTRYITVALEDIYQSQNASAVIRTSDCFGIQDVHIIENSNQYDVNPYVALGSSKWLNLKKYNKAENNTLEAINSLRQSGYRIVATTPHANDVDLENFDLNKGKVALFFGTEQSGLSDIVIENSDEFLRIPMYGFTESFNISVSAAIILNELTNKLRNSEINWQLIDSEKEIINLDWLTTTIKSSSKLIEEFLSMNNNY